ncbi:hypothetical protein Tco_0855297 [Tanacetum coccineum]
MDYTTSQLYDDVDIRLNEPVDTDKGFIQEEVSNQINRVTSLEQEVVELKKDPFYTQVTALVDDHLDSRMGETRDEFMNFLLESLEDAILAKESSQPQSSYEAVATLIEFELKKILIDKMDKSESYLAAPEHRECYEGLIKSYDLYETLFSTYDKSEEPEFEVADSDMPQDQEENPGNDNEEPKGKALWGILHGWRNHKTFYGFYATRPAIPHMDVSSMTRFLAVNTCRGDFPCLRISDLEDMLLFVVQNRLINLSGDDVSNFAIALRMFTIRLVIQKRVEDLQLGVKSYQ